MNIEEMIQNIPTLLPLYVFYVANILYIDSKSIIYLYIQLMIFNTYMFSKELAMYINLMIIITRNHKMIITMIEKFMNWLFRVDDKITPLNVILYMKSYMDRSIIKYKNKITAEIKMYMMRKMIEKSQEMMKMMTELKAPKSQQEMINNMIDKIIENPELLDSEDEEDEKENTEEEKKEEKVEMSEDLEDYFN